MELIGLTDILEVIAQCFKWPTMVVLILLLVVAAWQLGDFLVEYIIERRVIRKVKFATMLEAMQTSKNLQETIETLALPKTQLASFRILANSVELSNDARLSLGQSLLAEEEMRLDKTLAITELVCKLGPMFGLLGTLIPLGPGIVALSNGDTATLALSLGVAFNTTIAGILSASVAFVISHIRKIWYANYTTNFELLLECMLHKLEK